jgi:hypothetical protein
MNGDIIVLREIDNGGIIMLYLEEYNSPKPDEYKDINNALLYKILFSDKPLNIIFYCENLIYTRRLADLMRDTGFWKDIRYVRGTIDFYDARVNIKFLVPTENNARGYKSDLSIMIGNFDDEIRCGIYACSFGSLIWFKDSKEFIEYFEKFKKQDKIILKFENGKGYEVY